MKKFDLSGRNVICGFPEHIFTIMFIDTLVSKCSVDAEKLCVVDLSNSFSRSKLNDLNIDVFNSSECSMDSFSNCASITFISLHKGNSAYLCKLLDSQNNLVDRTYVHLTDDEVDRWVNTKKQFGELKPTKRNNVSPACITALSRIKNYIAPEWPFRERLSYVLNHSEFNLFDGRDAFKTMPTKLWEQFSSCYDIEKSHTAPEKKVLIGAKQGTFSLWQVIALLRALKSKGKLLDFKYMLFTYKKNKSERMALDLYCLYLRHFRRCNIDISYQTATNSITYNALIMSASHLILQDRGSMTTARSYISLGRGVVHVNASSPNMEELAKSERVDVEPYSSIEELAANIVGTIVDVSHNRKVMMERYSEKYSHLKEIYNPSIK
ncbi:hypothetical protein [Vibrio mediterranei]|uniref:hypothetical protein n=1 Tax=Vibrio mediterranei TaxID=689 RepID=UPI00406899BC